MERRLVTLDFFFCGFLAMLSQHLSFCDSRSMCDNYSCLYHYIIIYTCVLHANVYDARYNTHGIVPVETHTAANDTHN